MKNKFNYQTYGSGKNIVMIHGWGMCSSIWHTVANELAKSFRITLFDLPGYGDNHRLSKNHDLTNIGEMVYSTIPEQSIIVGWSMDGLVSMWLAIHYPQLVNKLILTSSTPCFICKNDWPGIEAKTLNNFKKILIKNPKQAISHFITLQVDIKSHQDARSPYISPSII